MLLELLSDFQITIPELGRVAATSQPVVVLTSNNSRELTEALKRRCLYLWLDYPTVEHELAIVRLHAPELADTVARKLVEVVAMVRELDLKKPPSIAESIDWARALLLLGSSDIDAADLHRDDVGDRQAPHRHRAGRRARRAGAGVSIDRQLLELGDQLRTEGVAIGTSELLDAFAVLGEIDWRERETLPGRDCRHARQVARGPARLRSGVRALLLPRGRGRSDRGRRRRGRHLRHRRRRRPGRPDRPRRAALADRSGARRGGRGTAARPRAPGAGCDRARRRGLRRGRHRRPADAPAARAAQRPAARVPRR